VNVGVIRSIHRYPVKSMLGETLTRAPLGPQGIPGDRAWAIRDETRGGIRGGKKIPELMRCSARYLEDVGSSPAPAAEIRTPEGDRFLSNDADANERLSKSLGQKVSLWPLLPADALDHYRRGAPDDPDFEKELRATFAREPGEALPELGKFPPEIFEYESPPGTYFDAFPLLIMTTTSLAHLQSVATRSRFDVRRFRPNVLIEPVASATPFPENDWVGGHLEIGDARIEVAMECPRCVMTTHGFDDLPKDPAIMRVLVSAASGNLGVYASVAAQGTLEVGAPVTWSKTS